MKLRSIEPFAASLPMKKPVTMAGETVTRADNVFVRLETDNGIVGWGEAASAPTMTGETTASMMAAIVHMRPTLIGRAAEISAITPEWSRSSSISGTDIPMLLC